MSKTTNQKIHFLPVKHFPGKGADSDTKQTENKKEVTCKKCLKYMKIYNY